MVAEERANGNHARSLLLTILGEYVAPRHESVWTGTLVAALGEVGVREKTARQALARSAAEGWLAGERVGRRARWLLTAPMSELLADGARRIYSFGAGRPDWDGRWLVLVVSVPEAHRQLRHRLRTGLAWAGFGSLGQGMWVSPDVSRAAEAAGVVAALGPSVVASSFVGRHGDLGDEGSLVARAWNLPLLRSRYEAFVAGFSDTSPASDAEAFSAQTRLVHQWRRFPFLDPGLPDTLLPPTWPGLPARELFERCHRRWGPPAQSWFEAAARP